MSEYPRVVTRDRMRTIMLLVGEAADLIEPLTPQNRLRLVDRWRAAGYIGAPHSTAFAPRMIERWLDDAVARGVLMAE